MSGKSDKKTNLEQASRRDFVKVSAGLAAGAALFSQIASKAHAAGGDVLRVGLVGCGGRGTGAASQALNADPNVKLVAMGDAFGDRLESSLKNLKGSKTVGEKVDVKDDMKFTGFDAGRKVIDNCDVVLLCEPPHFRPAHLRYAIEKGKHVFAEKPVAVDGPGVRSVIESAKMAKEKGLSLVNGLCWRYDALKKDTINRCIDGGVGEIRAIQCNYLTGGLWMHPRKPEWSDMEWQVRNWTYFTWLAGDLIAEQHIHSLDKAMWVMKDVPPARVLASGGRQVRTQPEFGHVYDHFNCIYEWDNGVKCFSGSRQWNGSAGQVNDWVFGSKGVCDVFKHQITGESPWKSEAKGKDMYQQEHDELFASIRSGKPINNGDYMAKSTLMAIMGRMAAYTGKQITWDQALNSKEDLSPAKYEWGPIATPPVPVPGLTKFA